MAPSCSERSVSERGGEVEVSQGDAGDEREIWGGGRTRLSDGSSGGGGGVVDRVHCCWLLVVVGCSLCE